MAFLRVHRARRLALCFAIAAGLVAGLMIAWMLAWRMPGRLDFLLHHRRFEAIVAKIKSGDIQQPVDEDRVLMVDGISAYVRRSSGPSGPLYTITLVTVDWGHAGIAGYLYSDQPPARIADDPYADIDAPGNLWILDETIGDHWWSIVNNLQ